MADSSFANDFKVGDWWIRPQRNLVERNDTALSLEPKHMAVLVCLADQHQDVVSGDLLLEKVWADSPFVGKNTVHRAISNLRRAFASEGDASEYIETIPREGYRLVAEVYRPRGSAAPLSGEKIDHYILEHKIGRGAMGVVYAARDERLGRPVAIKFLAPELTLDREASRRFQREAELAASLEHPNLVTILAVGETANQQLFQVTPLYSAGSLKNRLEAGPLSPEDARRWVLQLASGLAAAHRKGIVHRDIKPANLLFDEHGNLKIADFGIAKLIDGTELTQTGAVLGTPAYKAPEIDRGLAIDQRSDIWSLGVVIVEMLTGRRRLDAMTRAELPEPWNHIVTKAMASDPEDRYQSVEELLEDLERPVPLARERGQSGRGLVWALVALLLAAIGLGVALSSSGVPRVAKECLEQALAARRDGNYENHLRAAAKNFQCALREAPGWDEAESHYAYMLAEQYLVHKRPSDLERAQELIANSQTSPASQAAEARLLVYSKRAEEAEEKVRQALSKRHLLFPDKDLAFVYVVLAEIHQRKKKGNPSALSVIDECLEHFTGNLWCRLKKAQIVEDTNRAITIYDEIIHDYPTQATALNALGDLYGKVGNNRAAIQSFRELTGHTTDSAAYGNLANALYRAGLYEEAFHTYESEIEFALKQTKSPALAWIGQGDSLVEQDRASEAMAFYRQALDQFDEDIARKATPRLIGQRAVCLAKLGLVEEARAAIAGLLDDPGSFDRVVLFAARIEALAGEDEDLYRLARLAIEREISAPELLDDAAFIAYRDDQEYLRLINE